MKIISDLDNQNQLPSNPTPVCIFEIFKRICLYHQITFHFLKSKTKTNALENIKKVSGVFN